MIEKKCMDGFAVLVGVQAGGTNKLDPILVITEVKLMLFNSRSDRKLGFGYHSSKKSLDDKQFEFYWLCKLCNYISRILSHQLFLLLNNFNSHCSIFSFPELENFRVLSPSSHDFKALAYGSMRCFRLRVALPKVLPRSGIIDLRNQREHILYEL